ncbi:hypothetical protein OIU77_014797 [Salix suchowensis]|uniref:Uncharacterized protein n=1 Tax=Salix suchowensis TaxID=1278906 RepID=A0ABQ8ZYL7_9ROSI|nr:hypothetical protein OIU77_014797 [Salix suchowensis]
MRQHMSAVRLVCILYKWDYKMLLVVMNLLENPRIQSFLFYFLFPQIVLGGLKAKEACHTNYARENLGKDRLGSLYKNYTLVLILHVFVLKKLKKKIELKYINQDLLACQ